MAQKVQMDSRVKKVLASYDSSKDHFAKAREKGEEMTRFIVNEMYSEDEKNAAKKYGKPLLTYNVLRSKWLALKGNEQLSSRKGQVKAVDDGQLEAVNKMQGRWDRIIDEEDLEDKFQTAFGDALVNPLGGYIIRRFKLTPDGYLDYHYDVGDPFSIHLDPKTTDRDFELEKCRWVILEDFQPIDVIEDMFDIDSALTKDREKWWNRLTETIKNIVTEGGTDKAHRDEQNDTYRILEMRERTTAKVFVVEDEQGAMVTLSAEEYRKRKKNVTKIFTDTQNTIHVTTIIPYFQNVVALDEDIKTTTDNFGVFRITSFRDNVPAPEATSLFYTLRDPQLDINKAKSQFREYVSKIISGGLVVNQHEEELYKALKNKGNQPGFVGKSKGDPSQAVHQLQMGSTPPEILIQIQDSMNMVDKISLLEAAMTGGEGKSGESGVLFSQKVERASAAINPYYKHISILRKITLEDYVDNFSYVYAEMNRPIIGKDSDGKMFQDIINMQMGEMVVNDVQNLSAYVELDEGEDNITVKEDNFNKLLAWYQILLQANPDLASVAALPLLQLAPIFGKEKILAVIDETLQSQSQTAAQAQELQKTKEALEMQEIQHGMQMDEAKLEHEIRTDNIELAQKQTQPEVSK